MLEEFLGDIGIFRPGQAICDPYLRDRFSEWVSAQVVTEDDVFYLAARVAAFMCEYLIDGRSAERHVEKRRIMLRLPIDASKGVYRDFDPYVLSVDLVREKGNLAQLLKVLCDGPDA